MEEEKKEEQNQVISTQNSVCTLPAWLDTSEEGFGVGTDPMSIDTRQLSRVLWDQIMPTIDKFPQVYQSIDSMKLSRYCDLYANWLKAKLFIEKFGTTFTTWKKVYVHSDQEGGGGMRDVIAAIKEYPQVKQYERLNEKLNKMEDSLGFDPLARIKISGIMSRNKITESRYRPPPDKNKPTIPVSPFNYRIIKKTEVKKEGQ